MRKNEGHLCELCVSYMLGECSAEERRAFERHLADCPSCREELRELREAWEALPWEMDVVEAPADLKAEVMSAVLSGGGGPERASAAAPHEGKRMLRRLRALTAAVAVLAALLVASAVWNAVLLYGNRGRAESGVPARIVSLQPFEAASPAYASSRGMACILQQDDRKTLVVYLYNLPATRGSEAYHVWLSRDGVRSSAGTFRVGDDGFGVLIMEIRPGDRFDAVGVTLEPDAAGTEPRGSRVVGAALSL